MHAFLAWATQYGAEVATSWLALVIVFIPLVGLEIVTGRPGARPSAGSRLKAVVFWMIWFAVGGLTMIPFHMLQDHLAVEPLFPSLAPSALPDWAGAATGGLLAAAAGDFLYYWVHRLQHQVPVLWRFHAIHHSVREMSGVTGYHHFLEPLTKAVLYGIPLSFFITDPFHIPVLGALIGVQGHYLHSTTRLNFGPLGRVLVDNRFHRIHHSRSRGHFNKNYGVFTPIWDQLFGTAYFPARNEWPAAGLEDQPEPQAMTDFLLRPFLPGRAALAEGAPQASSSMSQ